MILTVHVKPGAKTNKVVSWIDVSTVKIDIKAQPKDGQANDELIKFLSLKLKLAKSEVILKRGHAARVKHIFVPDDADLKLLQG